MSRTVLPLLDRHILETILISSAHCSWNGNGLMTQYYGQRGLQSSPAQSSGSQRSRRQPQGCDGGLPAPERCPWQQVANADGVDTRHRLPCVDLLPQAPKQVLVCPAALQTIPGRIDLPSLISCLSARLWTTVEPLLLVVR